MTHTVQAILPWLQFAAGSGSGVIASAFFTWMRQRAPQGQARWLWLDRVLWTPRYARIFVLIFGAFIAVDASVIIARLTTGEVTTAFDMAFAAAVSGVASQIWHLPQLDPTVPGGPTP